MASQYQSDHQSDQESVPPAASQPEPESAPQRPGSAEGQDFAIGAAVRLARRPRYLKTADPMPMLRPPDLIDGDEIGTLVEKRALDLLAVRFRRGTFLLQAGDLEAAPLSD